MPYRLATHQDRQEQDTGIAGVLSFVGCGTYAMKNGVDEGTRTYEMPESKSGALPTWLYPNVGGPKRIRTSGTRLRRPLLYPAEL